MPRPCPLLFVLFVNLTSSSLQIGFHHFRTSAGCCLSHIIYKLNSLISDTCRNTSTFITVCVDQLQRHLPKWSNGGYVVLHDGSHILIRKKKNTIDIRDANRSSWRSAFYLIAYHYCHCLCAIGQTNLMLHCCRTQDNLSIVGTRAHCFLPNW